MFRRSRHRSKHFLKPSPDVQWSFLSRPFYSSFEGKTNLYIVSNPDDIFLISSGSTQGARACQAGEDQVQVEQVKEEELDRYCGEPGAEAEMGKGFKKVFGLVCPAASQI